MSRKGGQCYHTWMATQVIQRVACMMARKEARALRGTKSGQHPTKRIIYAFIRSAI